MDLPEFDFWFPRKIKPLSYKRFTRKCYLVPPRNDRQDMWMPRVPIVASLNSGLPQGYALKEGFMGAT